MKGTLMNKDSKFAVKIKEQINKYTQKMSAGLSKPERNFVFQMLYGILTGHSVRLSNIARQLGGWVALLYVIKRLSRNLGNKDLGKRLGANYLSSSGVAIDEQTVLALDLSDIAKPYARKMDWLCPVWDGSEGEVCDHGYWWLEIVAAHRDEDRVRPIYSHLYSSNAPDYNSENTEIFDAIRAVRQVTGGKGIWVIDRGGDRILLFNELLDNGDKFIIRIVGNRDLIDIETGEKALASKFVDKVKCSHRQQVEIRRHGWVKQKTLRYGSKEVRLPGREEALWLVVIKGYGKDPIILLTDLSAKGALVCLRLEEYLLRWKCEESIRFVKQQFKLEDIRVLRYVRLKNMLVFVHLAFGFLSALGYLSSKLKSFFQYLLDQSQRIHKIPKFFYYALADGLSEISLWLKRSPSLSSQNFDTWSTTSRK